MSETSPSASAKPAAVRFAGLRFTPMSVDQAVQALAERDPNAPFAAFVTANAEHAYLRRIDPEFRTLSDGCFVSTNDSRVLGRVALMAGLDLDFAPGAYVVPLLFERVLRPDEPVTIIGCAPALVADLKARYGLTRVAHHNPPMGFIGMQAAVREAVDFVAAHPARFVFVAMGPPQSEKFCQRVIEDGRSTGIGLCIGSSLAVLTEQARPAPDLMEKTGFVWLYRLAKEPRRLWRRYLVHAVYGVMMGLGDMFALRLGLKRAADV